MAITFYCAHRLSPGLSAQQSRAFRWHKRHRTEEVWIQTDKAVHGVRLRKICRVYCAVEYNPAASEWRVVSPNTSFRTSGLEAGLCPRPPHRGSLWIPGGGQAGVSRPHLPPRTPEASASQTSPRSSQCCHQQLVPLCRSPLVSCDPQKPLTPCIPPSASEKDVRAEIARTPLHRSGRAAHQPYANLLITQATPFPEAE